jgi:hypothetical protein
MDLATANSKVMKMLKQALILLQFSLMSFPAMAQFLDEGTLIRTSTAGDYFGGGVNSRGPIYVVPNELNPEAAIPILEHAEAGAYVSVGAERGLIGALLSKQVTHLVQIDLVPEVVLYNQLNVVLLKVAQNRQDYLELRGGSESEWKKRSTSTQLNDREKQILASAENAKFFASVEGGARERLANTAYFKGSSFLRDEKLFAKAQAMAKANRIQVLQGNLTDYPRLLTVANELKSRGIQISVLDMSNAWEEKYIGPVGIQDVVKSLSPALFAKSIIMGTSVSECIVSHLCFWNFRAYTFELLSRWIGTQAEDSSLLRLFAKKKSPDANRLYTDANEVKLYVGASARTCQAAF